MKSSRTSVLYLFLSFNAFLLVASDLGPDNIFGFISFADDTCDPEAQCASSEPDTFVLDPQNCHNFYVCVNKDGEIVPSDASVPCPSGEYFDTVTASCLTETETCQTNCASQCASECEDPFTFIGDSTDCSKYYICTLGNEGVAFYCPDDNPYFNGETCTSNEYTCCDYCSVNCNSTGIEIADPYDCSKFYICITTGTPSEDSHLSCPDGEVFDTDIGGCSETGNCVVSCTADVTTVSPSRLQKKTFISDEFDQNNVKRTYN